MMARWIAVLCLVPAGVFAGWYVETGVAVHSVGADAPEISPTLRNPIGTVEIGRSVEALSIYARHMSSITAREEGTGLNEAGVKIRYEWR